MFGHSSHCWEFGRGLAIGTSCRATNLVSVALLKGMSLLEAKVLGKRVGGLHGLTEGTPEGTEGMVELGVARARSYGNIRIGRSGATMWKIVSKETTFKGVSITPEELG